jgi:hypothetical protein
MSTALLIDETARAALQRALATLELAEAAHRPVSMSQALLRVGRCYRALGALAPAEAALQQALRWAHASGSNDLRAEVLCESAETAAERALRRNVRSPLVDLVDPARAPTPAAARRAARERARDLAYEAAALAGSVCDPRWEVQVLLCASDVLAQCGDLGDAEQLKLRAFRRSSGSAGVQADAARLPATGRGADA